VRQPGISATVNDSLELLRLFVTEELIHLVNETKRYATQ